jgi:hypothetical protein
MAQNGNPAGHSRREFLMAAGIAAAFAPEAAAGHAPASGTWEVRIRWHDRNPIKVTWNLSDNGTFTSSDGFGGTWIRSGSLLLFAVRSDAHPSFAGNVSGGSINGGVALQPGGIQGYWSAELLPG